MARRTGSKYKTGDDWANYDFRTWDPGKLQGLTETAIGNAFRSVTASPDWAETLATGVAAVTKSVLPSLQGYLDTVHQKTQSLDERFAADTAAARQQAAAFQENARTSAAPPQPAQDPGAYQVGVKVADKAGKAGLSGVQVRIFDTRNTAVSLASATTDLSGNAVLRVGREQIESGTTNKESGLVLEVQLANGKSAFRTELSPKLNRVDTVVAQLEGTAELKTRLDLAKLILDHEQQLMNDLSARTEALSTQRTQVKAALDEESQQIQKLIADMK